MNMILLVLLAWLLSCAPVQATVAITEPNGFNVACDAGYTRSVPHLCSWSGGGSQQGIGVLTLDNTCRSVSMSLLPSSARLAVISLTHVVTSNNAVALRTSLVSWFSDSSCTTLVTTEAQNIREMVATAAGTTLLDTVTIYTIPIVSGTLRYMGSTTGGTGTIIQGAVIGYHD